MIPKRVLVVSSTLGVARFVAFIILFAGQSTDAQWQLVYLPLWVADFPVSRLYRFLPIPLPEALIGPVWWFCFPLLVWRVAKAGRRRSESAAPPN